MIDFNARRFCIFGLQGSGKTTLMKHILLHYPDHLIVDTLHKDYKGFNRYLPQHRTQGEKAYEEINIVIDYVIKQKIPFFAVDEANVFFPNNYLPPKALELNDFQRHYGTAFGIIARRPTQVHTDLVELAHYLICFRLGGKNDRKYLNDTEKGLGNTVAKLNAENHEFIFFDKIKGQITKHKLRI